MLPEGTQGNPALSANEIDQTDAERAALAERDAAPAAGAEGTGATPPAAVEAGAGVAPAAAGADGAPAGADAAAGTGVSAVEGQPVQPAAAAADPAVPVVPFTPTYAVETRDFGAEVEAINKKLTDLKADYKAGKIDDDDAYEQQYEALREERAVVERAQDRATFAQQLNQQNADQAWAYLQRQFLSAPENAAIAGSPLVFAAWEQGMQVVVNEAAQTGRQLTDWDILSGARAKLVEAGMLGAAPAAPTPPTPPPAKPDRTPPLQQVPAGLSSAPAAADPGARAAVDTLSGDSIEDLETRLAGMSEAQRDELLKQVPGSVVFDA